MEWRGSRNAVSVEVYQEMLCAARPGLAQATFPLCHQRGTLLCSPQKMGCGLVVKEGEGGKR